MKNKSEWIKEVKRAEKEGMEIVKQDRWRAKHHLMGPVGWINDPNGLCYFKGKYHIFFQYSPLAAEGGDKFWGHYTTKDFVEYEYLGAPLAPDQEYDKDGVFSGSAFVKGDTMHLFYTGNVLEEGEYDYTLAGRGANVIHVVSEDGVTFSPKKCILTNKEYPAYYTCHIRDPKVWEEEGRFYMVLGGRDREDKGRILLYGSKDLENWEFEKDITTKDAFGFMWECPDWMTFSKTGLLGCCPQGLPSYEFQYENVDQAGYFMIADSLQNLDSVTEETFHEWDMGFDFYAPQTFLDEKGRRILIGWMGLPVCDYTNPTVEKGWQHTLTVPRVLTMKDGMICQWPVEEYENLREREVVLQKEQEMIGFRWEEESLTTYEVLFDNRGGQSFEIEISKGLQLRYDRENEMVSISFIGEDPIIGSGRMCRKNKMSQVTEGRILVDTSVVEVYLNQGQTVFATRYYPKTSEIWCKGEGIVPQIYSLKKIKVMDEEGRIIE